jgi:hypothetical protein
MFGSTLRLRIDDPPSLEGGGRENSLGMIGSEGIASSKDATSLGLAYRVEYLRLTRSVVLSSFGRSRGREAVL